MKECNICGAKFDNSKSLCPMCGAKVDKTEKQKKLIIKEQNDKIENYVEKNNHKQN